MCVGGRGVGPERKNLLDSQGGDDWVMGNGKQRGAQAEPRV